MKIVLFWFLNCNKNIKIFQCMLIFNQFVEIWFSFRLSLHWCSSHFAMRVFLSVQEFAANVGIYPLQPGQTNPLNRRNIRVLLIFSLYVISYTAFIVFDANSFHEYAEAFFPWVTSSLIFIGLSINISMTKYMFRLLNNCERIIESGE